MVLCSAGGTGGGRVGRTMHVARAWAEPLAAEASVPGPSGVTLRGRVGSVCGRDGPSPAGDLGGPWLVLASSVSSLGTSMG